MALLCKCVLRFTEVGWHAHDSIVPALRSFVWSGPFTLYNCMIGPLLPCVVVWLGPDYLYDCMTEPRSPCMIVWLDCDHPVSTYDQAMPPPLRPMSYTSVLDHAGHIIGPGKKEVGRPRGWLAGILRLGGPGQAHLVSAGESENKTESRSMQSAFFQGISVVLTCLVPSLFILG